MSAQVDIYKVLRKLRTDALAGRAADAQSLEDCTRWCTEQTQAVRDLRALRQYIIVRCNGPQDDFYQDLAEEDQERMYQLLTNVMLDARQSSPRADDRTQHPDGMIARMAAVEKRLAAVEEAADAHMAATDALDNAVRQLQGEAGMSVFVPTWPWCGYAACDTRATYVDSSGVGYCDDHHDGSMARADDYKSFDPWWACASAAERDGVPWPPTYGEWPADVKPPLWASPGWGLPIGGPAVSSLAEFPAISQEST